MDGKQMLLLGVVVVVLAIWLIGAVVGALTNISHAERRPGRPGLFTRWVARRMTVVVNDCTIVARGPFGLHSEIMYGSTHSHAHALAAQLTTSVADWLLNTEAYRKKYSIEHAIAEREAK